MREDPGKKEPNRTYLLLTGIILGAGVILASLRKQNRPTSKPQSTTTEKHDVVAGLGLCEPNHPTSTERQIPSNLKWEKTKANLTFYFQLITLIFFVPYVIVTYFQWREFSRSMIADQRPWITLEQPVVETYSAGRIGIMVAMLNTGKTPEPTSKRAPRTGHAKIGLAA